MQAPLNNPTGTPQESQSSGAPGTAPFNGTSGPEVDWSALPRQYRPFFSLVHPSDLAEHNRVFNSLLAATPDKVRFPTVLSLPTSIEEEFNMYRLICVEFMSQTLEARKNLITITNPIRVTLDHVFLALTVLRQPSNIDASVLLIIEIIQKMLERFRAWAVSQGAVLLLEPCDNPEAAALHQKNKVAQKLLTRFPLDNEAKWLYAMLRAVGNIPELWGYQAPPTSTDGSNDTPAARGNRGNTKQERVASVAPELASGGSNDSSSTGAQAPATAGKGSETQSTVPPHVSVLFENLPPQIPSAQSNPFRYYQGPYRGSALFGPEPSPTIGASVWAPALASALSPAERASRVLQYREANASLPSLASSSSGPRGSFSSAQRRVTTLEDIVALERQRLAGLGDMRDIAQGISDFFFRGLFTLYSHQFVGAEVCQAYRDVVLKAPDAMVPLVKAFCQHMETDVAILTQLGKI